MTAIRFSPAPATRNRWAGKVAEAWPEVADFNRNIIAQVLAGRPLIAGG